ncbi:hypothetical protein Tco_1472961 [Tanacetum coccineum]
MKEKKDPCILVGYSTQSKGYRVYNKRTKLIVKSIHINFDELKEMVMTTELGIQDHINEPLTSKLVLNVVPSADISDTSQQELDLLFSPLYEEYFTAGNQSVSKKITMIKKQMHSLKYEFINPFTLPGPEVAESSSRNINTLSMHTFYQRHHFDYHWTKDHPLEQVRGNASKLVQTRQQLATDPEMCMFALTVTAAEVTNIKEAMADHT